MPSERETNTAFQYVAHRGLTAIYPENTMLSYEKATAYPIDMLEIDVHMTKDGQLVLIHDDTINRTSNGTGAIKDMTLAELRQYDYGSWKGEAFRGLDIPLFSDVLNLANATGLTLLIELKKPKQYPGIVTAILDAIETHDVPSEQIILQSFDHEAIREIKCQTTQYALGYLLSYTTYQHQRPDLVQMAKEVQFANPNYLLIDDEFMKVAHEHGLTVLPYTVNDRDVIDNLKRMHVDGIITDCVHEWLDETT